MKLEIFIGKWVLSFIYLNTYVYTEMNNGNYLFIQPIKTSQNRIFIKGYAIQDVNRKC